MPSTGLNGLVYDAGLAIDNIQTTIPIQDGTVVFVYNRRKGEMADDSYSII
ncbi:hypothetical protein [Sporosarcina cyprini]|uniref:hypothetical protein n=1 Tax=Sporosarcina cyprini TaxID=2910523 RepID=UPI001EDFAE21|nr:hypothetical protein [Sporosarcina cyprini]MCG3089504.1 hypothetical protein [Sporosarcina cyprini]